MASLRESPEGPCSVVEALEQIPEDVEGRLAAAKQISAWSRQKLNVRVRRAAGSGAPLRPEVVQAAVAIVTGGQGKSQRYWLNFAFPPVSVREAPPGFRGRPDPGPDLDPDSLVEGYPPTELSGVSLLPTNRLANAQFGRPRR